MPQASAHLRAALSRRIRAASPADWLRFGTLWTSFNSLYGGEPDARERARVVALVRRFANDRLARRVLRRTRASIDRVLSIPPGNMRLESWDPRFRAATQRWAAVYRSGSETSVSRLAAVAAIMYQVRCNLTHGYKDPIVERDRMLVRESLNVLEHLVPELENAMTA
jgi:hypothetical protein